LQTFEGTLPIVTDKLPGDIWHGWRYMVSKPKSNSIYVAVGVNCNICLLDTTAEGIQFASIYSFDVVTKKFTQVASGDGCYLLSLVCYLCLGVARCST
jgi:glucose/arabinose dehydrogenase